MGRALTAISAAEAPPSPLKPNETTEASAHPKYRRIVTLQHTTINFPPIRRMPLGLKRQINALCRAYRCGFCDLVARLQQKMCCRPNLTPLSETPPARHAAKRVESYSS